MARELAGDLVCGLDGSQARTQPEERHGKNSKTKKYLESVSKHDSRNEDKPPGRRRRKEEDLKAENNLQPAGIKNS
jgi:hypothetical protein